MFLEKLYILTLLDEFFFWALDTSSNNLYKFENNKPGEFLVTHPNGKIYF